MNHVTIYTWPTCPYCHSAKALLNQRGIGYTEIEVDRNPDLAAEMTQRAGRRTVPQVFIGDHHVGGNDDLQAAAVSGLLDELLSDRALHREAS